MAVSNNPFPTVSRDDLFKGLRFPWTKSKDGIANSDPFTTLGLLRQDTKTVSEGNYSGNHTTVRVTKTAGVDSSSPYPSTRGHPLHELAGALYIQLPSRTFSTVTPPAAPAPGLATATGVYRTQAVNNLDACANLCRDEPLCTAFEHRADDNSTPGTCLLSALPPRVLLADTNGTRFEHPTAPTHSVSPGVHVLLRRPRILTGLRDNAADCDTQCASAYAYGPDSEYNRLGLWSSLDEMTTWFNDTIRYPDRLRARLHMLEVSVFRADSNTKTDSFFERKPTVANDRGMCVGTFDDKMYLVNSGGAVTAPVYRRFAAQLELAMGNLLRTLPDQPAFATARDATGGTKYCLCALDPASLLSGLTEEEKPVTFPRQAGVLQNLTSGAIIARADVPRQGVDTKTLDEALVTAVNVRQSDPETLLLELA